MLIREHFEVKETAVAIITDDDRLNIAKDAIFDARTIIERKIFEDPFFRTTYDPYPVRKEDHPLIQRMCKASELADVGPMASVAGAVSVHAVEVLQKAGSTHSIIENGGDIAILCDKTVTVGIYSGNPVLEGISLRIEPSDRIRGICSSSGKIGPSVSLGNSDISTVLSDDVILADAAATRLGNLLKEMDLAAALETVGSLKGVEGCIASVDGMVAMYGDIPELVSSVADQKKITKVLLSDL